MIWQGQDFCGGVSSRTCIGGASSGAGPILPPHKHSHFLSPSVGFGPSSCPPEYRKEWAASPGAQPRHPAPEALLQRSTPPPPQ